MDVAAAAERQPKMPGLATLPRSKLAAAAAVALASPVAHRTGLPRAVRATSLRKSGVVENTTSMPAKECTTECLFKLFKDLKDFCEELLRPAFC